MEINEIDVFIDANGEVRVEVRGLKGGGCLLATKELERALGGQVVKREMTGEFSESPNIERQNQQWQSGG